MTGRTPRKTLAGDMEATARIVTVEYDEDGAILDLECDGIRYRVRPPAYERSDDQTLRAYQQAVLVPGDDVLTAPHPGTMADLGHLADLRITRAVVTLPALRQIIKEGMTSADYVRILQYVRYARPALGRFGGHIHLRQQISDRHAADGRCNRIVLEKSIGSGSYIIGDSIHLSLRSNPLPETVLSGIVGRDVDDVVRHPLTEGAGITILRVGREGSDAILDLDVPSMTFAEGLAVLMEAEGKRP